MQSLQDSTTALPVHTFCCTIPINYDGGRYPLHCSLVSGLSSEKFSDKKACNTNIILVDNFIKKNSLFKNKIFSIFIFVVNE